MNKMLFTALSVGLFLTAMACNGTYNAPEMDSYANEGSYDEGDRQARPKEAGFDQAEDQRSGSIPVTDRQLIRRAAMRMAIEDYDRTLPLIRDEIHRWNASVEREEEHRDAYRLENELLIRVLPEKLDSLLETLELLALQVDFKRVEARDVTQQYVDLSTRLDAKRAAVDRYRQILQAARSVEEVLDVEDHLRLLIEEIESTEQQLRALKDQVSMSTLELSVYEEFARPEVRRKSFWSRIASAFGEGWEIFLSLLVGLVSAWPIILILAILVTWFFRYRRRKKG